MIEVHHRRDDSPTVPGVCQTDSGRLIITYRRATATQGRYTHLLYRTSAMEGGRGRRKFSHALGDRGRAPVQVELPAHQPALGPPHPAHLRRPADGLSDSQSGRRSGSGRAPMTARASPSRWTPASRHRPGQIVELQSGRLLLATHRRLRGSADDLPADGAHLRRRWRTARPHHGLLHPPLRRLRPRSSSCPAANSKSAHARQLTPAARPQASRSMMARTGWGRSTRP